MKQIPDKSVSLICADLPYGKTKNKWDSVIDLPKLWVQYNRIIKSNGAIILFGQDKFSARLMLSNEKMHRYNIIWEKTTRKYMEFRNYFLSLTDNNSSSFTRFLICFEKLNISIPIILITKIIISFT